MSFAEEQSSGDQPSVKSGWREARILRFRINRFKSWESQIEAQVE